MDDVTSTEPANWSGVEAVDNASEAAIVVGFLESHGIPARVHDKSFHEMPTTEGDLTQIEVAVPTERLEEARAALAKREAEFAKAPEDAILTDEGPVEDPSPDGDGSNG